MRASVGDGRGGLFTPILGVVVDRTSGFCFGIDIGNESEPPHDVAARLLSKVTRTATIPERVQVCDAELATALRGRRDLAAFEFEVVDRLEAVDIMLSEMEADMFPRPASASVLGQPGMSIERLGAFADGAALFYQARPWRELHDDDVIDVASPAAPKGMRCASILGAGGQVMGIGFFANLKSYHQSVERGLGARGARWALMYHAPDELSPEDADAWREHGLRVVTTGGAGDDDAIPVLMRYHGTSSKVDRADGQTTSFVEGLCRAIAMTSPAEMDSGRWEKTVDTFDGLATYRLSIPHLLAPPAPASSTGASGPAAMERAMRQIQRMVQSSGAQTIDEMNALLTSKLPDGQLPDETEATTDTERAIDLCNAAESAPSRRALQMIREALQLDADCAEAHVLLAQRESDPAVAEPLYRQAIEAGRRTLGEGPFTVPGYPFWGAMESRPFMRAMAGLAESLAARGRAREAGEVMAEMLRLNPPDNQGIRYLYVPVLIAQGRLDEARAVIESSEYRHDDCAVWGFSAALIAFRQHRAADADRALTDAMKSNQFAAPFMLAPALVPPDESGMWSRGDEGEAMMVADALGAIWRADRAALEWLAASFELLALSMAREKGSKKRAPRKKRR